MLVLTLGIKFSKAVSWCRHSLRKQPSFFAAGPSGVLLKKWHLTFFPQIPAQLLFGWARTGTEGYVGNMYPQQSTMLFAEYFAAVAVKYIEGTADRES